MIPEAYQPPKDSEIVDGTYNKNLRSSLNPYQTLLNPLNYI